MGDVRKGLQVAQLHGTGLARERFGCLDQHLRGLGLAFCVDDLGPARTLGFGLFRHGADHAFIEIHILDLDVGDLDSPGLGVLIEDLLDIRVQFVASQLVGVVMARYILELDPFKSLPIEQIAETIAPNLQRYLTGELPGLT